ncbi:similar to Saccharomyces cerevisiae YPR108W RPN7 Essential [Maudiozyma barnettii]|uniref:Similar to Saccharomyces cerevisiae YPR108W RPN7 Essential n=1 Tax=Maudiozyma barnettii TaxID=61262 RepID=A0A8H2ZF85_9SACH|nr:proteasome regulatory particle lid subunit RPN7 [Kazachstania barnettii]CAB4252079.1 similar to Saccharomyces cerevisiae YPR108W RPN7 Essential [Kazachstania barnettii]CAD1778575.1 similar to Saccharomyces cerevisiae YPR108W RPN7 Essential [Kazachstania barnettii]
MSKSDNEQDNEDVVVEPQLRMVPSYDVSDKSFLLAHSSSAEELNQAKVFILEQIEKDEMAPYYKYLTTKYLPEQAEQRDNTNNNSNSNTTTTTTTTTEQVIAFDSVYYEKLVNKNNENIKILKDKLEVLKTNDEGPLEIANAWIELGQYYVQIADFENAEKILLGDALSFAISMGAKIDIYFMMLRLAFFYNDFAYIKEKLDTVNSLIEKGGDWERRNRFKTYLGIYSLAIRDFKKSAELLVDSLATFTSIELTSYENIAMYASVAGLFALERTDLKLKIIDSPELLSLITSTPALQSISSLTIALYTSDYASFFPLLLETYDKVLLPCKYLNKHADYFVREMRRKVYAQLLDSYKTLSLKSMAHSFGVSVEFLDNDLGKFIPNKQLNCVIDRVNGIVETKRPDNKNGQYHQLIRQGDGLLTKLQKYGAAVKLTGSDYVA